MKKYLPLLLLLVILLGGIYYFFARPQSESVSEAGEETVAADCRFDQTVCRYFAQQAAAMRGGVVVDAQTTSADGQSTFSGQMKFDSQGNMEIISFQDGQLQSNMLIIDQVTYIKAADQEVWFKLESQSSAEEAQAPTENLNELEASYQDQQNANFTKIASETCGERRCDKYQLSFVPEEGQETESEDSTELTEVYIWIDQQEYLARKMEVVTADSTTTMTYSYENVSLSVPSPVQEMPNFGGLPTGNDEPTSNQGDIPSQEEIDALMQQYGDAGR